MPPGLQQAQGAQVDLLVAGVAASRLRRDLGEGRRVEHHQRKLAARGGVAGQQIEDVGFLEIDVGDAVGLRRWRAPWPARARELSTASTLSHLPARCRAKPPVEVKQSSALPPRA